MQVLLEKVSIKAETKSERKRWTSGFLYFVLISYLCPAPFTFFIFNKGWLFFSNSNIEKLTRNCRNCYHKIKRRHKSEDETCQNLPACDLQLIGLEWGDMIKW